MFSQTKNLVLTALTFAVLQPAVFAVLPDDDEPDPENDARVVRIRHMEGEALVKRTDADEWEAASINLPLVEGDEIKTLKGARIEIQFDNDTYLRIDENASVKLSSLGAEGVAVGITEGNLLLSVFEFDPANGYLEVDAPQTTVAVTKAGKYRIEAGTESNRNVGVWVWGDGTARVYTADSGFTLKNDQSATMSIDGPYAGKWEISNANAILDAFEDWSASRDSFIEKSLDNAQYGKYYDSDLYGADDLTYYGSWQYNDNYGYVWRPYDNAVSIYDNWSPYRYGQWRWLPYYGWTWVNDEPWGWATYHYGRWLFLGGRWYWTPYSYSNYYSYRRSWWRPAVVYISYVNNRLCWYPLPYNYSYYDYNRRFRNRWRHRRNERRNDNERPEPTRRQPSDVNIARAERLRTPPFQRIPPSAVITSDVEVFGTGRRGFDTAPPEISRRILDAKPVIADSPPFLPNNSEVKVVRSPDIFTGAQTRGADKKGTDIGAGERRAGVPLDTTLRNKKIAPRRPVLTNTPRVVPSRPSTTAEGGRSVDVPNTSKPSEPRRTPSTVQRSTFPKIEKPVTPRPAERKEERPSTRRVENTPPVYTPAPSRQPVERKPQPPANTPPPRSRPAERKPSPPANNPPPRRTETRRPDPPKNNTPTRSPAPPSKPPPAKSAAPKRPSPRPPVNNKSDN